jgi:hypothetical protein
MRMIGRSKMNEWLHWHGPRLDIVRCLCITKETKHLKIKYNKHLILIRLDFVYTGDISNYQLIGRSKIIALLPNMTPSRMLLYVSTSPKKQKIQQTSNFN